MNFQAASSEQGRGWEEVVLAQLRFRGWKIGDRHVKVDGVEIDVVAISPLGITWWIECKGSHRGKVPGCLRDDTVKKAVGVAYHLMHGVVDRPPYMLITSDMPRRGTKSMDMLDRALSVGAFRRIGTVEHCLRAEV